MFLKMYSAYKLPQRQGKVEIYFINETAERVKEILSCVTCSRKNEEAA
jgi:hypothetical protein